METEGRRLDDAERDALRAALAPVPVDEIRALRRIPRDPRHASKTDVEKLRKQLRDG